MSVATIPRTRQPRTIAARTKLNQTEDDALAEVADTLGMSKAAAQRYAIVSTAARLRRDGIAA